jgi:hypothetical protein
MDIFEYVPWYMHIHEYTGLATTTVMATTIASIFFNIEKGNQSN